MSAIVAFKNGEVFLKSVTYEKIIDFALESIPAGRGRDELAGAKAVGALWPERLADQDRSHVLRAVLDGALRVRNEMSPVGSQVAALAAMQAQQLIDELRVRFPEVDAE